MGRNLTPTSILEAKGGFITHKNRQRPNEPTSDRPLGSPPTELTKEEKKYWKRLAAEALPGVLCESDRLMFALLVRLTTKFYLNQPMKAAETNQMITLSSKFAMNSADRSRVSVEKPKTNSLTKFIDRKTA